jgi:endonuclease YncB( thermonuclease family)
MKVKSLIKLVPVVAIVLMGGLLWQYHQHSQAQSNSSPDYESAQPNFSTAKSEPAEVIKVYDGDTITVRQNGQKVKVRLCGVDAPELKQSLGRESRDKLRSLIPTNQRVTLYITDTDRYGRKVAEVFIPDATPQQPEQERNLNDEMVRTGMAYYYAQYGDRCPNGRIFAQAEEVAREKRLGVWGSPNAIKPWDYRKASK